jgi:branched-subunit amino acid aminotransferase/4-amino-4-deoxychorismate lyase
LAGSIITDLLAANKLNDTSAVIKLICPRDPAVTTDTKQKPATCLIIKTAELDLEEIQKRQSGLRAKIIPWSRNSGNPLLGLKSLNYLENRYALQNVKRQGFDEGIFLNQAGELCEGTFSNLFLIRQGVLLTPPLTAGILPGITRAFILEKTRSAGIESRVTPLFPEDFKTCDGAFLTSSLMHLAPLTEINRIKFDPENTAPLRKILRRFFQ